MTPKACSCHQQPIDLGGAAPKPPVYPKLQPKKCVGSERTRPGLATRNLHPSTSRISFSGIRVSTHGKHEGGHWANPRATRAHLGRFQKGVTPSWRLELLQEGNNDRAREIGDRKDQRCTKTRKRSRKACTSLATPRAGKQPQKQSPLTTTRSTMQQSKQASKQVRMHLEGVLIGLDHPNTNNKYFSNNRNENRLFNAVY